MNAIAIPEDITGLVAPPQWPLRPTGPSEHHAVALELRGDELALCTRGPETRTSFPVRSIALARWDSARGPAMAAALSLEGAASVRIGCVGCRLPEQLLQRAPVGECDYVLEYGAFVELLMALSTHRASPLPRPRADPYRDEATVALAPVEVFALAGSRVSMKQAVRVVAVSLLCALALFCFLLIPNPGVEVLELLMCATAMLLILVFHTSRLYSSFVKPTPSEQSGPSKPSEPKMLLPNGPSRPRRGSAVLAVDRERVWIETPDGQRVAEAPRSVALAGARDVEEWQQQAFGDETGDGQLTLVSRTLALTLETPERRTVRVFARLAGEVIVEFAEKGSAPACHKELELDAAEAERLVRALRGHGHGNRSAR